MKWRYEHRKRDQKNKQPLENEIRFLKMKWETAQGETLATSKGNWPFKLCFVFDQHDRDETGVTQQYTITPHTIYTHESDTYCTYSGLITF